MGSVGTDGGGDAVLVVEDDVGVRRLLEVLLSQAGLRPVAVADGDHALEVLARDRIALVLLDSGLPGLSGRDVLHHLRADPRTTHLPVIIVSGRDHEDDLVGGLDAGADDYITKPFSERELLARVRARLRARPPAVDDVVLDLRDVVDRGRFHPVFQPVVDLRTGLAAGYEALTRFESGAPPDQVFERARRTGMAGDLEIATAEAAVSQAGSLPLPPGGYLSLNLSPSVIETETARLAGILGRTAAPVVVEITERAPVEDYDGLNRAIAGLGSTVVVAVDDAGAGYASLRHVLALRPGIVKVDRTLVQAIETDVSRQSLLRSLARFAGDVGTSLVAEGVETEPEAATVEACGIGFAQGYLYGRPAPAP